MLNENQKLNQKEIVADLPTGWTLVPLNNIATDIYRYPSFYGMEHLSEGVPVIRGEHIQSDGTISHSWENYWYVSTDLSNQFPRTILKEGDLVMSVRGSVGKVGIIDPQLKGAQLSPNCIKIAPNHSVCAPRYLLHYLKFTKTQELIQGQTSATTIQTIKASVFKKTPVPLAPISEQKQIVGEIEKQFTRLDAAVAGLKRVQANLERYKASVLKAACEGRLVPQEADLDPDYEPAGVLLERILAERRRKWEEHEWQNLVEKAQKKVAQAHKNAAGLPSNLRDLDPAGWQDIPESKYRDYLPRNDKWKKKYKEPEPPNTDDLPELPAGWVWATVEQLAAHEPRAITDGPFGSKLKTEHYTESGPRVIRLQNIGDGNFIDENAHISFQHYEKLKNHRIYAGDLVIAGLGMSLPRACIIPSTVGPAIVKADCIRFKPHEDLGDANYLKAALNSEPLKRFASTIIHGIGRPRLNQQEIKSLVIPLPPIFEQHRIALEVEKTFSVIGVILSSLEYNLRRAERLRQSILQQAFSGKLVPRDEDPVGFWKPTGSGSGQATT